MLGGGLASFPFADRSDMNDSAFQDDVLSEANRLLSAVRSVLAAGIEQGQRVTSGGKHIDDYQVHVERLAYLATELQAAEALLEGALAMDQAGVQRALAEQIAFVYAAETAHKAFCQAIAGLDDFGFSPSFVQNSLGTAAIQASIRRGVSESRVRAIGRQVIAQRGIVQIGTEDEVATLTRRTVRDFAQNEVAPLAEQIHRADELVPDALIARMAAQGFFAASVPEEYGGANLGHLVMVITTEELSAASLGAAGSLITRPEILVHALLQGGTADQKRAWLPKLASGQIMAAIAVTEPDVGSDVASVSCRADKASVDDQPGYVINGAKAWSTFAGRADILGLLARTELRSESPGRGLSLFIVPKQRFYGHAFEQRQANGGSLSGKAIATIGYRGMHSFRLNFDNFFIPEANLVGGESGLNRGFYLQMGGFAAGRLQTAGRALGLSKASLERACEYAEQRQQFGRQLRAYQLTQHKIGRMATHVAASQQLTYAAARAMDRNPNLSLEPASAKLLACDMAVSISQDAQLLHGGWGYAEEMAVSRYVVDALVLPIFEGVKPVLELKIIARSLLA